MKLSPAMTAILAIGALAVAAPAFASANAPRRDPGKAPAPEPTPAPPVRPTIPTAPLQGFGRTTPPTPGEVAGEVGSFLLGSAELFGDIAPLLFGGAGGALLNTGAGDGSGKGTSGSFATDADPWDAFRYPTSPVT